MKLVIINSSWLLICYYQLPAQRTAAADYVHGRICLSVCLCLIISCKQNISKLIYFFATFIAETTYDTIKSSTFGADHIHGGRLSATLVLITLLALSLVKRCAFQFHSPGVATTKMAADKQLSGCSFGLDNIFVDVHKNKMPVNNFLHTSGRR